MVAGLDPALGKWSLHAMLTLQIYYSLLLIVCIYAATSGSAPEKIVAAIMLVGSLMSTAVLSGPAERFRSLETGVFWVDVIALLGFLFVALRAERFWPLWVAGLQLVATVAHLAKLIDPHIIRAAYAFVLAFWSYPILVLTVVGIWRHQRRLARFGADKSWSS